MLRSENERPAGDSGTVDQMDVVDPELWGSRNEAEATGVKGGGVGSEETTPVASF